MRRIKVKRSKRGLTGVGILVLVICAVLFYNTNVLEAKIHSQEEQMSSYNKTKEELLKTQEELKDKQVITMEDIEKMAREKLGLVYENEIILTPNE